MCWLRRGFLPDCRKTAAACLQHRELTPVRPRSDARTMEDGMRLLLGIILGALITVGGAYIYDSAHSPATTTAAVTQRPLVNWDVVASKWNGLTARARTEWTRLAG